MELSIERVSAVLEGGQPQAVVFVQEPPAGSAASVCFLLEILLQLPDASEPDTHELVLDLQPLAAPSTRVYCIPLGHVGSGDTMAVALEWTPDIFQTNICYALSVRSLNSDAIIRVLPAMPPRPCSPVPDAPSRHQPHSSMSEALQAATHTLKAAVDIFGHEALCLSFNGGKDSTVLLHLLLEAFPKDFHRFPIVYFEQPNEFPEVLSFISECEQRYNIKLMRLGSSYKEGLQHLTDNCKVKAILLGTRFGDPRSENTETFLPNDPGWPITMRVHPILRWTYSQVWEYLQPRLYCSLYRAGYTSLGSTKDTLPNPKLRKPDGSFRAAAELQTPEDERMGRVKAEPM